MTCRGCGEERKLIKAHIIPRSFYIDLRNNAKYLHVIPSKPSLRVGRSHIGDYDMGILCHDCDQYLATFDEYGKQVLIKQVYPFEEISREGVVAGWTIRGGNAIRLEKFILSILWRASLSERKFFQKVKLGPYEKVLKEHLWGDESHHKSFGCVIAKFRESKRATGSHKTILDPHPFRYEGKNYYRLYLGGYVVWVRVDQRNSSDIIRSCELSQERGCLVVSREFDTSKEFDVIHKGVLAHER